MFSEMINALKGNKRPSLTTLRGPLNIALIKKEAILRLPTPFQVIDSKINPRTDHMLWASILLNDKELFDITTSIHLTEISIKQPNIIDLAGDGHKQLKSCLAKLLATIHNDQLRDIIDGRMSEWLREK